MRPESGLTNPEIASRVSVLPAPLGPNRTVIPARASKAISRPKPGESWPGGYFFPIRTWITDAPLLVMTAVITAGFLFGALAVVLAIPAVAVLTTLVDVTVRHVDPAEQDVPTVLFPAREADR